MVYLKYAYLSRVRHKFGSFDHKINTGNNKVFELLSGASWTRSVIIFHLISWLFTTSDDGRTLPRGQTLLVSDA